MYAVSPARSVLYMLYHAGLVFLGLPWGCGVCTLTPNAFEQDHDYTDPRSVPVAPGRYGMVGEYSNVAAFLPGHEWQPGRCHAMKPMNTTAEQADYLIKTLAEIEAVVGAVSASVYTQTTSVTR